ncbi:MAG TPA: hypothetical protein VLQ45_08165 [Thermoanaerobaculia bacterium]|nr:hypothetical protein [Thermoanaerobaculia bacterium]
MIVQEVKHRTASGYSRWAGGFASLLDGSGQLLEVGLDGGERYAERMVRLERKEGAVGGGGLERGEIRRRVASSPVSLEVELHECQGNGVGSLIARRARGCCLVVAFEKVVKQRNGELLGRGLLREVVDRLTKALDRSTGDVRVTWGFGKQFAKRCQRESVGRRIAAEGNGVGAVFGHVLDQAMDQGAGSQAGDRSEPRYGGSRTGRPSGRVAPPGAADRAPWGFLAAPFSARESAREDLVDQIRSSWNSLLAWLRELEDFATSPRDSCGRRPEGGVLHLTAEP